MRRPLALAALSALAVTVLSPAAATARPCVKPCVDRLMAFECTTDFQLVCKVRDLVYP